MSNPWSDFTKRLVLIGTLIGLALILYRFSAIIPPLVITAMVAYLLNPPVELICTHTRLSRNWAVVIVYLLLLIILSLGPVIFVPTLIQQVQEIDDLASIFLWLIFIIVISFYLLKDADRLARTFEDLVPPSYQMEFRQLRSEVSGIWNAFLRGQLILCAVVGTVVAAVLAVLGVRNALVLGLLAGVLEIIPNLGPTLAAVPAVLIAYFQGSAHLPLTNGWFALLVIAAYVVIQQVENNYLVPRIIGRSLNLHPLVVIIGAIAGGTLAGVLGILLAAPTLATLRVLAHCWPLCACWHITSTARCSTWSHSPRNPRRKCAKPLWGRAAPRTAHKRKRFCPKKYHRPTTFWLSGGSCAGPADPSLEACLRIQSSGSKPHLEGFQPSVHLRGRPLSAQADSQPQAHQARFLIAAFTCVDALRPRRRTASRRLIRRDF